MEVVALERGLVKKWSWLVSKGFTTNTQRGYDGIAATSAITKRLSGLAATTDFTEAWKQDAN